MLFVLFFRETTSSISSNIGRASSKELTSLVQAGYSSSRGRSNENQNTRTYTVEGFKNSLIGSETFVFNKKFLKESLGSVAISEAKVRQYGAIMNKNSKPAFTDDFSKEITKLHSNTIVVSIKFIYTY